jgi:CheY-like chemotaxis protein
MASRRGTVLLVEDDDDVRNAILEVLEDNGYRVVGAANGKDALDAIRTTSLKPALVLLDLMMPVMDGPTFRAAQRDDPTLESIPVVVLTAHPRGEETAANLYAAGFLRKPISLEKLLATVGRFCGAGVPNRSL